MWSGSVSHCALQRQVEGDPTRRRKSVESRSAVLWVIILVFVLFLVPSRNSIWLWERLEREAGWHDSTKLASISRQLCSLPRTKSHLTLNSRESLAYFFSSPNSRSLSFLHFFLLLLSLLILLVFLAVFTIFSDGCWGSTRSKKKKPHIILRQRQTDDREQRAKSAENK